jgi:hypothetical protein
MPFFFDRLYGRLRSSYFLLYVVFDLFSAAVVCLAAVGLFSLYEEMSPGRFWEVVLFSEACVGVALVYVVFTSLRIAAPLLRWIKAGRPADGALDAWRSAGSRSRSSRSRSPSTSR